MNKMVLPQRKTDQFSAQTPVTSTMNNLQAFSIATGGMQTIDSVRNFDLESQFNLLNNEMKMLQTVRDTELLPLLLDLIENLKIGKISPKDFANGTDRIRIRLNKMKQLLSGIEGLDEPTEARIKKMEDLNVRIQKKNELLAQFKEKVGERLPFDDQESEAAQFPNDSLMDVDS